MPVAIDLGVLLAAFLALVVSFGALYVWRGTGKPFLLALALAFNVVSVPTPFGRKHLFGTIAKWLQDAAETIDHSLAQLVLNSEKAVVLTWHGMAKQAELLGRLLGDLAETFEGKWRWWFATFPPAALTWLAVRAARELPKLTARARVIEHNVTKVVTRTIHTATTTYVTKVVHASAAATRAVTAPLPYFTDRVHGIDETLKETLALARRNAKLLTGAGAAALVLSAVGRLGLSWIRCPSLKAINDKHGCSPWRALEHLLAPALDVLVFIDICVIAHAIRLAADAARPVLNDLLIGVDAALCKGKNKPPPELAILAVALPPVPDPLTL